MERIHRYKFTEEQKEQMKQGLRDGLKESQILVYFREDIPAEIMKEIRLAYQEMNDSVWKVA